MDRAGFHRSYLLDLHNVALHPHRFKFNWRRLISEVGSAAHSFLVDGAFPHSARHRFRRLRKAAALTGYHQSISITAIAVPAVRCIAWLGGPRRILLMRS